MRIQICFLIVLLFVFSSFVSAQNESDSDLANLKETTKFDDFGDISEKEFAPKLTKFYWLLRKSNDLRGYVIFYSSDNSSSFKQTSHFADGKMRSYQKYLDCGCIDSMRLTLVRGGLREKTTTELWLVPTGGIKPQIINSGELIKDARYKLELLGTKKLNLNEAKIKVEVIEDEDWENEKSEIEFEAEAEDFAEELTEILSRDKTWRAVLIFYADKDEYDIDKSRQIIDSQLQSFVKNSKLDLSRVKIMFGGYRRVPEIETWIVNKNGIEPEPMPDEKIEE